MNRKGESAAGGYNADVPGSQPTAGAFRENMTTRAQQDVYSTVTNAARGSYARFYAVVSRIPKGRVATYGQVAELAGLGGHARQVGYALYGLGQSGKLASLDDVEIAARVPWHRVVNARGEISARSDPDPHEIPLQRVLLEEEGVVFDLKGRLSLEKFRWKPRMRAH